MNRCARFLFPFCVAALFAGCNSEIVRITGEVVRDGKPVEVPRGVRLRLVFIHDRPEDNAQDVAAEPYLANVNQSEATFSVPGRRGKGIPAGKYHIVLQMLKGASGPHGEDLLKGAFSSQEKPFIREFTSGEHLVIDLDKPPT